MITEDKKITLLGTSIWLLASLFFLYEYFLRTFIGSVANQVMDDFSFSVNAFAWVTSAYYFSYGAMQIPVGMLLDKFGVRKILIFGTSVCALSSIIFSHSGNFTLAFISRLIMGFGSSFGFLSLLVIAANWFPHKYNGLIVGISLFLGTLGPILAAGPMVKILLDSHLNWQHLMEILGLCGLVLALIMFFIIKDNNRDGKRVTIYLRKERPFSYYLKTLSKNPQVWLIAIYSGIIYVPMILIGGSWGVPYLQSLGFSNEQAANIISLMWIGYAIGSLSFGGISDKIERRRPVLLFAAINNIALVLLMMLVPAQSIYFYSAIFLLLGVGSAGQTVAFSTVAEQVDFATKATALGISNTSITIIASFTPILAGCLIHMTHQGMPGTILPSDFFSSFMMIPVLSVIAGGIVLFSIKETFCKFQKDPIFLKIEY